MHARPGIPLARAAEISGYLGLLEGALLSPVAAPWRCRLDGQCGGHRMAGYRPALACSTVFLAAWPHDIVAAQVTAHVAQPSCAAVARNVGRIDR
jgi:hypothetical protein